MDAELEKLVESGKLTAKAAEQLEQLRPGSFCLHKSWGFGQVAEWNLLLNQIVIDFKTKPKHPMQLGYAAENLTPIPPKHFLSRKVSEPDAIKALLKSDPAAVVRNILEGFNGKATLAQISEVLVGDLFTEAEWKRWWTSTKKAMKSSGYFSVPTKKSEPIALRAEPVSRADELLAFFNQTRQSKEQAAALDQIIRFHHEFKDSKTQLQPIVQKIENTAAQNQKLHSPLTFELVLGRDDLLEKVPGLTITRPDLTMERLISEEEARLIEILPKLPAAKERRVLQALPRSLGDGWTRRAWQMMRSNNPRLVAQIPKIFVENGKAEELQTMFERAVREHSASSEMMIWLCRDRANWPALVTPELLPAILSAIERDQHNEASRSSRLRDLLLDDRDLISDMFAGADVSVARDIMRRLLLTPVFDDLTKRSLMARVIKLYPELESIATGAQPEDKAESLIVSWSSLQKRQEEYEEIVNKKIPENSKEIGVARSYGDLRENFEFKAAKQMQAVLMRRKSELEQMLHRARGTDFSNADTSQISIGTVVSLREVESAQEERYTVLGAWDGEPERHIISYQTAIGQSLLGKKSGDRVTLNTDHGSATYEVIEITAAPTDVAPAPVEDQGVALGAG
ncbi:MAG TPA: GreA/GreB family elongation factor [Chthoniobacterales bacterium]|nr:GreA/GreB family elongation factor [Chthoniobacterales bacterium]